MRPILTLAVTALCAVTYGCTSEAPNPDSPPAKNTENATDSDASAKDAPKSDVADGDASSESAPAPVPNLGAAPLPGAAKAAAAATPVLTYFNMQG